MIFKINKSLSSPLSSEEINNQIQSITKSPATKTHSSHKFEGKIASDHFVIYPIFDLAPRNQFRPEIEGNVTNIAGASHIKLQFRVSSNNKVMFVFLLVFNLFFAIVALVFSFAYWWIILIAIAGFILSALFNFNYKVASSIQVLRTTLKAKEIPAIT